MIESNLHGLVVRKPKDRLVTTRILLLRPSVGYSGDLSWARNPFRIKAPCQQVRVAQDQYRCDIGAAAV